MSTRFFEGLLIGGVMGFLFGLLSAPKSGSDLRKDLADNSEELYKQASDSLTDLKEKTGQAIQQIQSKSEEVLKKASLSVQETREQLARRVDEIAGQGSKVLVEDTESATIG